VYTTAQDILTNLQHAVRSPQGQGHELGCTIHMTEQLPEDGLQKERPAQAHNETIVQVHSRMKV